MSSLAEIFFSGGCLLATCSCLAGVVCQFTLHILYACIWVTNLFVPNEMPSASLPWQCQTLVLGEVAFFFEPF